jgi:hypothetical protein
MTEEKGARTTDDETPRSENQGKPERDRDGEDGTQSTVNPAAPDAGKIVRGDDKEPQS